MLYFKYFQYFCIVKKVFVSLNKFIIQHHREERKKSCLSDVGECTLDGRAKGENT